MFITATKTKTKIIAILLTLVILSSIVPVSAAAATSAPTYEPTSTYEQRAEEIRRVLARYSPDGYFIMNTVARLGTATVNDLIAYWARQRAHYRFFSSLEMAVHKEFHTFQDSGAERTISHLWGGSNVARISVPREIVMTEEATSRIPGRLRTSKWDIYVSPGSYANANLWGAYGLLGEFSAYYYGYRAALDATEYLFTFLSRYQSSNQLTADSPTIRFVSDYFNLHWNATLSFYEFTYWTLEYMLFLKANHPERYNEMMNDMDYREAFTFIYNRFYYLVETEMPKIRETAYYRLTNVGVNVPSHLYVRSANHTERVFIGYYGLCLERFPENRNAVFKAVLDQPAYKAMLDELLVPPLRSE
jgi:hypothetical protein